MGKALLDAVWRGATEGHFDPTGHAADLEEGQRLQVQLLERWRAHGETVGGWKLGMTSGRSRDAFGPGFRPFGFILKSRILNSGGQIRSSEIIRGGIENELCFVVDQPLGAGTTPTQARAAIAGVAPAFEVNQRRIQADAVPGIRIADDLANWGLVIGETVPAPDSLNDLTVVLTRAGVELDRVHAAGHIDDHYESLATLANKLAQHGLSLQPGDRVITGAFTRTGLETGTYEGNFGQTIGCVTVQVAP
jgi:2-oxo-hept-3-ene-1,7-dioate hydratase